MGRRQVSEVPEVLSSALPERYRLQRVLGRGGVARLGATWGLALPEPGSEEDKPALE